MEYGVIIRKEIYNHLISLRFMLIFTVSIAAFEAGALVMNEEYEKAKRRYDDERGKIESRLREQCKHGLGWFALEGPGDVIRPPTKLWFLASDQAMALNGVTCSNTVSVGNIIPLDAWVPRYYFFGTSPSALLALPESVELDWVFIVGTFLSLMALILVYDSISGEKEMGTLRLILSNSIPRYTLLISKILAAWICLLIPLSLGVVINLVIMGIGGLDPSLWIRFLMAFILSGVYLLAFICIGILISVIFRDSASSIAICFLIWATFIVILPGVIGTWMVGKEKPFVEIHKRGDQLDEFWLYSRESPLEKFAKTLPLGFDDPDFKDPMWGEVPPGFYRPVTSSARVRAIQLKAQAVREIQEAVYQDNWETATLYLKAFKHARNMMRLSISSIYRFAMQALAGSDLPDYEEFLKEYNNQYRPAFMKFVIDLDRSDPESLHIYGHPDGFSRKRVPYEMIPRFVHKRGIVSAISRGVVDIGIIALSGIFLFLCANLSFMRADVR